MRGYTDLHKMSEDDRIDLIGKTVLSQPVSSGEQPKIIGVCVDDDVEKAEMYIQKLKDRFSTIRVVDRFKGPTPGVITIRISGPKP